MWYNTLAAAAKAAAVALGMVAVVLYTEVVALCTGVVALDMVAMDHHYSADKSRNCRRCHSGRPTHSPSSNSLDSHALYVHVQSSFDRQILDQG